MIDLDKLRSNKSRPKEFVAARIDPENKTWLVEFCTREGISLSLLVAELIAEYRAKQERKK